MFSTLLAVILLSSCARVSSSFYDNEQDPLPPTADELHRRWDFEVLPTPLLYLFFLVI